MAAPMTPEERAAEPKRCQAGACEATIVIVGSVFTIYRCKPCGAEEWL